MKPALRILIFITTVMLAVLTPQSVFAQNPTPQPENVITGDQVVIGNTYRLAPGDTLDGSLLVIGGTATISNNATLNGDLVLIGGTVTVRGKISGDIVTIGGAVNLESMAVVEGGLTMLGASLNRSPLAKVAGGISEQSPEIFNFDIGDTGTWKFPFMNKQSQVAKVLNTALQALAMAVLAVILGLLLPNQVKRVADTVVHEPVTTSGVGVLSFIVAPIIAILLAITIILIPISVVFILLFGMAIFFGFTAIGFEIGQRFAALFKTTWHPSIAAGIGVLLLGLVTGYANFIPCIGWFIGAVVAIIGLGAVVISRFGSSKYADRVMQAVIPPVPPQQPTTPPQAPVE